MSLTIITLYTAFNLYERVQLRLELVRFYPDCADMRRNRLFAKEEISKKYIRERFPLRLARGTNFKGVIRPYFYCGLNFDGAKPARGLTSSRIEREKKKRWRREFCDDIYFLLCLNLRNL